MTAKPEVQGPSSGVVAGRSMSWACPNECGNGVSRSDQHPTWHCWRCRVDAVKVEYVTLRASDYERLLVPRDVAERLAEALLDAADTIAAWAGCNHAGYHEALSAYDEFRAVFPKAEGLDAREAGRRVVEKHGDALRRLSDKAEEA